YFVAEYGASGTSLVEWRAGQMRIRHGQLEERAPADAVALFRAPSRARPWEVSSDAIAGMPYLASFLTAIYLELGIVNRAAPLPIIASRPPVEKNRGALVLSIGLALVCILAIVAVVATRS